MFEARVSSIFTTHISLILNLLLIFETGSGFPEQFLSLSDHIFFSQTYHLNFQHCYRHVVPWNFRHSLIIIKTYKIIIVLRLLQFISIFVILLLKDTNFFVLFLLVYKYCTQYCHDLTIVCNFGIISFVVDLGHNSIGFF